MKIRMHAALGAALSLTLVVGCSASDDSGSFQVQNSQYAVAPAFIVVATHGRDIAFLASEGTTGPNGSGGTPLNNHDSDTNDTVAIVIDGEARTETNLEVAAIGLAWAGDELYLLANEVADNFNWNSSLDGITNTLVLLHWSKATPIVQYVDTVSAVHDSGSDIATKMVAVGTTLFYSSATLPSGPMASNLRALLSSAPLTPIPVATTDTVGPLQPRIVGAEEGLVLLALSETVDLRQLNGDTDPTPNDTAVLALLDGTALGDPIHVVGLAMPSATAPLRAKKVAANDWQVGFLVDETAQGGVNLNHPTLFAPDWLPGQCSSTFDTDTSDTILHYLRFDAWTTNPGSNPIRNTGLVGVDKIAIANGFIATITPENTAAGLGEGTCNLNQDTDKTDRIARWTRIESGTAPILPLNSDDDLHALFDCPGGTHGLAELDNRFVIVVDEEADNRDFNNDSLKTFNLVGELLPSTTAAPWDFAHTTLQVAVGASWMQEQPDRRLLNTAVEEAVGGVSKNNLPVDNPGDVDFDDSVVGFGDFAGNVLTYPGAPVAVDATRPGILVAKSIGFSRVDEFADNRRWNGDNDKNDKILFRSSFIDGRTTYVAALNSLDGPAVYVNLDESAPGIAAFITQESVDGASGTDHNHDTDAGDYVLRWFTF